MYIPAWVFFADIGAIIIVIGIMMVAIVRLKNKLYKYEISLNKREEK